MNNFHSHILNLICSMVLAFQKNKLAKRISYRISRGRAPSLSDLFENSLAILLENYIDDEIQLFVDFPISYKEKNKNRKTTIYPDIALIKNDYLIGLIEAKIDLGYFNVENAKKRKKTIKNLLMSKNVTINSREIFIDRLISINVILSGSNHSERIEIFRKTVENPIILISSGNLHPNDDKVIIDQYFKQIQNEANIYEWTKLNSMLEKFNTT